MGDSANFPGDMLINGSDKGEGECCKHREVKVDPAKLPPLTWQRKLNCDDISLSEFDLKLKEMVALAPLGFRLWRYLQEEKAKGKDSIFINPFIKRVYSSCQGVPLGGMGKHRKKFQR